MDGSEDDMMTKLRDKMTWWLAYEYGYREARYPMPAIPVEVGYEFEETSVGYCWICSEYMLWTYWPLLGRIIEERAECQTLL